MMNEPISKIMTGNVVTVTPDDSLNVVKDILFSKRIHHIPVLTGKKLVGIITSYDLVKLGKGHEEYGNIKVKEIMTQRIGTLSPNDKIGAAAEVFLENLIHGLPIVNENNELVGIITTHDVLKYEFLKEYPKHQF
ncbi:MAG: CBS domain-containing protein [Phaeodactylibacter sp.]|nr:CBS domain-containing protein [Phaeodactylibacter sp.]MCB9301646.1 CBS domain-containing protein [Lewinellaceae bacterium]HQU59428.1 CBS domain-containing protein [Saprospiraceae bacterium]